MLDRARRSPGLILTALALTALLAVGSQLPESVEMITKWGGTFTLAATAAVFASRILFWSAPYFGRLQMSADDNPNGEVRHTLAALRRWAPRRGTRAGFEWFCVGALTYAFALFIGGIATGISIAAAAGAIVTIGVAWWMSHEASSSDRAHRPIVFIVEDLDRCSADAAVRYLETIQTLLRQSGDRKGRPVAKLVVLVLADSRWIRTAFSSVYRDFEPLGDPAKSLGADFLQKLFEHTILVPESNELQTSQLVRSIADSTNGKHPSPLPSPDPLLSEADTSPAHDSNEVHEGQQDARAEDEARADGVGREIATAQTPEELQAASTRVATVDDRQLRSQLEAEAVQRTYAPEQVAARQYQLERHLDVLPPNPRLIKRVNNYWAMLQAVRLVVGHDLAEDTLMRAAIVAIQFPSLAEQIQHSPWLPEIDRRRLDTHENARREEDSAAKEVAADMEAVMHLLGRPDIGRLLGGPDGIVLLTDLARALGRTSGIAPARSQDDDSREELAT